MSRKQRTLGIAAAMVGLLALAGYIGVRGSTDWKMYKDNNLEFRYPADFTLSEETATSKLFTSDDGYFWLLVENNPNRLGAEALKDEFYKNDEYGFPYEDSYETIAGIRSYKQGRYDLGVIENYFIPTGDSTIKFNFEFNFDRENQQLQEDKKDLINKIISSVRAL